MRLLEQGETEDLTQRVGVRVAREPHKEVMGKWMMLVCELYVEPSIHSLYTIVHFSTCLDHRSTLHIFFLNTHSIPVCIEWHPRGKLNKIISLTKEPRTLHDNINNGDDDHDNDSNS